MISALKRLIFVCGYMLLFSEKATAVGIPCQNRTDACIQKLGTFITLDNPQFVNEIELDRLCRDAEDGQRCSSDFLHSSNCINPEEELTIPLHINRSLAVMQMLCRNYIRDSTLRQEYLKNSACIEQHFSKLKSCYKSANMLEDPESEIVRNSTKSSQEKYTTACCAMEKYIECSKDAIKSSCGNQSTEVVSKMLSKAAGQQLQEFCWENDGTYPQQSKSCVSSGSYYKLSVYLIYLIVILIFILQVFY